MNENLIIALMDFVTPLISYKLEVYLLGYNAVQPDES
jgi:hypothetical protein